MRDFRDAKNMAQILREALAAKHHQITVGESLEIIAHLFGVSDWNTLSALIKNLEQHTKQTRAPSQSRAPQFVPALEGALREALRAAHNRFHTESGVEHLLLALTGDPDATAMMNEQGVNPAIVREVVSRSAEIATHGDLGSNFSDPAPSPAFQRVVQRAILDAQMSQEPDITGAHLLISILSEQDGTAARILRGQGLKPATG